MNYPLKAEGLKANDAKLGGKYRMSNVREFIALAYLLYLASERKASVDYSDGKDSPNQLKLNPSLFEKISSILLIDNLESLIVGNPLLSGQFEYILVAMERVFCLGSVAFNNRSYNNSKERTGGIRYPKTLKFSTNMMVLDLILSSINQELRNSFLKEWLQNRPSSDNEVEKRITSFLTICSQYSLFRVRTEENDEIVYRPIGIYEQIAQSGNVSIVDSREQAGTASIYNNVLKEGLNPWLNSRKTNSISFNEDCDITTYLAMLKTSLNIVRVSESDLSGIIAPKVEFDKEQSDGECFSLKKYLAAIRTKPFLLLAGISGTGKSRIVRKLAQMTITEELQRKYDKEYNGTDFENDRWNLHTPANFKLIQVKPNWHNSMDVVGYLTNIPEPHYVFTPFVEFIARAWQHQDVPFFLCLDEMNLAPVEEYFAEFLSAIESRAFENRNGERAYVTDPIIKPFADFGTFKDKDARIVNIGDAMVNTLFPEFKASDAGTPLGKIVEHFKQKGLTLPKNLIVIGTVNMDETTYSFSRKVLDRAMSFEMNEVDYKKFLKGTTDDELKSIREELKEDLNELLTDRQIEAKKVMGELGDAAKFVIDYLDQVNKLLNGTPFKLGYRAANEAMLYVKAAHDTKMGDVASAMNDFTLMKILSRFEGDSAKMHIDPKDKRLTELGYTPSDVKDKREESTDRDTLTILSCMHKIISDTLISHHVVNVDETNLNEGELDFAEEKQVKENDQKLSSLVKLESMMDQLNRERFVSYWN